MRALKELKKAKKKKKLKKTFTSDSIPSKTLAISSPAS